MSSSSSSVSRLALIASVIVALVFLVNGVLISLNRGQQDALIAKQTQLQDKQNTLRNNASFNTISQGLLQAVMNAATVKKDEQMKALLKENDIPLDNGSATAGASAPAAAKPPVPPRRLTPPVAEAPPAAGGEPQQQP